MEGSHHKQAAKLPFTSEEEETGRKFTVHESQPKRGQKAHYNLSYYFRSIPYHTVIVGCWICTVSKGQLLHNLALLQVWSSLIVMSLHTYSLGQEHTNKRS